MEKTERQTQKSTVNAKMVHANGKTTRRKSLMAKPWLVTLANNSIACFTCCQDTFNKINNQLVVEFDLV